MSFVRTMSKGATVPARTSTVEPPNSSALSELGRRGVDAAAIGTQRWLSSSARRAADGLASRRVAAKGSGPARGGAGHEEARAEGGDGLDEDVLGPAERAGLDDGLLAPAARAVKIRAARGARGPVAGAAARSS
jgi:hypothetical protein